MHTCKYCREVLRVIENKHPDMSDNENLWCFGDCCKMWEELSKEIPNSEIEFPCGSDGDYSCTCPNCGNSICSWCV